MVKYIHVFLDVFFYLYYDSSKLNALGVVFQFHSGNISQKTKIELLIFYHANLQTSKLVCLCHWGSLTMPRATFNFPFLF